MPMNLKFRALANEYDLGMLSKKNYEDREFVPIPYIPTIETVSEYLDREY